MTLIDWSRVKDAKSLISALEKALLEIFGKDFIDEEIGKFKQYSPKRSEALAYLRPYPIHRAARWFMLLEQLKEHGYTFDLRFSAEIEEFMWLLLFTYSIDLLVEHGILQLVDKQVKQSLRNREEFESRMYEVVVAANYTSNGFKVELPDVLGKGRVDVRAQKGSIDVYCECKRLRRREEYIDIAIEVMRRLHERKASLIVDIELTKAPRSGGDVEKLIDIIEKVVNDVVNRGKESELHSEQVATVRVKKLPEMIQGVYEISIPSPEHVEYVISAAYVGVFNGVFKVKEPKLVIVRDPSKLDRVTKQLMNNLRRAREQLSSVNVGGARKTIYVDVSEVAGKSVLQLPEMIRIHVGPEIFASQLETLCRDWLTRHSDIDAVVLTQLRLYVDEFGNPYLLNVENRVVTSFTAPGWAIEVLVIPIPRGAPPEHLVNLGAEAARRGNYRLAYIYYMKAIEMKPDLKEAYNNLGKLLTDIGRPDEALRYLDIALKLDPNYVSALINKGIALARMGMLREALEYLDRATHIEPNNEKAWCNKALVHYMLGELDKAREEVLRALTINPDYELAQKLKEELEKTLQTSKNHASQSSEQH